MDLFTIPHLFCPFPSAINQHADTVHQGTLAWVQRFGLISTDHAYQRFDAGKFGWLAARAYPDAALEELQIVSDWNTWLFMLDDQCDEGGIGYEPERLSTMFSQFMALLNGNHQAVPPSPLANSLADLRRRLEDKAPELWMQRFNRSVEEYFGACSWEAGNRRQGVVPTVEDYIAMRPLAGGLNTDVDLIDLTEGIDLPDDVRLHPDVQQLTLMANNVVCWSNDIFSLQKEMRRGDVHNLVLVLRHAHSLTLQAAVEQAAAMHNHEVRSFIGLAEVLPAVDAAVQPDLDRYVAILRSWMRGNYDWSLATGRYRPTQHALTVPA